MDTRRNSATILIIENDLATINLVRPALECAGYRVHLAATAPSAQALAELRPDLLVIGLAPGSDETSWQVVRDVAERSPRPSLPIIVYGGDGAFVSQGDVRTHARAAAVLARPVRLETLLPVVSHTLEHHRHDWRMDIHHLSSEPLPESAWGW